MIVKNESAVIQRCLESVKDWIDYWVIVDTGSSDGTKEIIREILRDIPGELHERPWVHFEHNRNEALALAKEKGDYLLVIDADERIEKEEGFQKPSLDKDCYFIKVREPAGDHHRIFLIDLHLPWHWEGIVHESLVCEEASTFDVLENVYNLSLTTEGARSKEGNKYLQDAALLEEALQKDPTNPRTVFYLAQSYLNAEQFEKALYYYEKRVLLQGWDQEVFWALYQIGCIQEQLGASSEQIIESYCKAYQYRPCRAEPLFRLANHYFKIGKLALGFLAIKQASTLPLPSDSIFVESWIYSYARWVVLSDLAFQTQNYADAALACRQLIQAKETPEAVRKDMEGNLAFLKAHFGIE